MLFEYLGLQPVGASPGIEPRGGCPAFLANPPIPHEILKKGRSGIPARPSALSVPYTGTGAPEPGPQKGSNDAIETGDPS